MIVQPDDVRGLWAHLQDRYRTTLHSKADALEMQEIGYMLKGIGILDADAFLTRFSTTLGSRIYVPFELGVPGPDGTHSLWSQLQIGVHEHQHYVQTVRDGLAEFALRYLASGGDRARYEAEAYRCNMELENWHRGRPPQIKAYMHSLASYGLSSSDLEVARRYLHSAQATVRVGGIGTEATRVALRWLNKHAAHLRFAD